MKTAAMTPVSDTRAALTDSPAWGTLPSLRGPAASGTLARLSDARGSVTVVMLGVVVSVLTLMLSGLFLASAVLASHRARSAADLAALAGAAVLMKGEPSMAACASAALVSAINHGRMEECIASGNEVRLRVVVLASAPGIGVASARSRAGPGPQSR